MSGHAQDTRSLTLASRTIPKNHHSRWQSIAMNGEENPKPVNVDPRWCVLEARIDCKVHQADSG